MTELKWVATPKNRAELLVAGIGWATEQIEQRNRDLPGYDIDLALIVETSKQYMTKELETLKEHYEEDPRSAFSMVFALGVLAGMYYRLHDDHTWKD